MPIIKTVPVKSVPRAKYVAASLCAVSAASLGVLIAGEGATAHALTERAFTARVGVRVYACRTNGTRVGKNQAVTVHISNIGASDTKEFFALDSKLDRGIRLAHVGEYDGNGIGLDGSGADYFAFGPNAILLWRTMRPIIATASPARGSYVEMSFGDGSDPLAKSTKCKLGASS